MRFKLLIIMYLAVARSQVGGVEDFYSSLGKMTTLITTAQQITKTLEEIVTDQNNKLEKANK